MLVLLQLEHGFAMSQLGDKLDFVCLGYRIYYIHLFLYLMLSCIRPPYLT